MEALTQSLDGITLILCTLGDPGSSDRLDVACRVRQLAAESPVQPGITMQPVLPMSWGADHRVLDGATLAKCSMALKGLLEHPERLLLDLR